MKLLIDEEEFKFEKIEPEGEASDITKKVDFHLSLACCFKNNLG